MLVVCLMFLMSCVRKVKTLLDKMPWSHQVLYTWNTKPEFWISNLLPKPGLWRLPGTRVDDGICCVHVLDNH
jgi:hypothetical protein